ncbi:MAG: outer membrane beta-barrel protein [bacterium]
MKKILLTILAAFFLVFKISPVSASLSQPISSRYQQQSASSIVGPYFSIGSGFFRYEGDFFSEYYDEWDDSYYYHWGEEKASPNIGALKTGYQFNSVFALETELVLGGKDDEYNSVTYSDFEIDIKYFLSTQIKLEYPSYVIPYLLLGVTYGRIKYKEDFGNSYSESVTALTGGGGVRLPLRSNHRTSIFMEYKFIDDNIFDHDYNITDDDLEQISFGLTFGI